MNLKRKKLKETKYLSDAQESKQKADRVDENNPFGNRTQQYIEMVKWIQAEIKMKLNNILSQLDNSTESFTSRLYQAKNRISRCKDRRSRQNMEG